MPELPEVESIRRSLEPRLVGRTVRAATLLRRDVFIAPGDPAGGFSRQRTSIRPVRVQPEDLLALQTITGLQRRGKQLALMASDGGALVVQLGMSGQLVHRAPGQAMRESTHIHATWELDDGRLLFRDPRRFGGLRRLPDAAALSRHWSDLGPDALTSPIEELAEALRGPDRPIKAALLDQSVIAGVGNIYADEALFLARVSPRRGTRRLTKNHRFRLAAAIRSVMEQAIEAGGSTLRDYVDADGQPGTYQAAHQVYGRGGKPCPVCGSPLQVASIGQRTTVWCAACQR